MPPVDIRSDPKVLRAVAHPVRLDLLDLLFREGPLTASRCAELLGLTAKVCSYHLNVLGLHGLIEETGTGKGRARPWRLSRRNLTYERTEGEDESTRQIADQFAHTMLARDVRQIENFISGRHSLPKEWRNVSALIHRPATLTPEQLQALGAELQEVLDRHVCPAPSDTVDNYDPKSRPVSISIYAVPSDVDV